MYSGWTYDSHWAKRFNYDMRQLRPSGAMVAPVARNVLIKILGHKVLCQQNTQGFGHLTQQQFTLINSAELKPSQNVHCNNTLLIPQFLYSSSATLTSTSRKK